MDCDAQADAQRLTDRARAQKTTLVTAESCTAGALASLLSRCDGAGEVFHGGLVTYSKAQKIAAGIPAHLLDKHTPVSAEVASAMVSAALATSPGVIGIAITGVAGPEPDEDGNPVGLVYIAAGRRGMAPQAERLMLSGSHDDICAKAMSHAVRLAMDM